MNRYSRTRTEQAGFTLTELMITLVVATILVSIAIPAYTSQMQKSRRTEAKSAVMDLASREEQFFATQNKYSSSPIELGYAAVASGINTFVPPISTGTYYQVTVAVNNGANPATFTITATPAAGSPQLSDAQCTSFIVDQTGTQSATGSLGNACWP